VNAKLDPETLEDERVRVVCLRFGGGFVLFGTDDAGIEPDKDSKMYLRGGFVAAAATT